LRFLGFKGFLNAKANFLKTKLYSPAAHI